jgi:hypothetical protein
LKRRLQYDLIINLKMDMGKGDNIEKINNNIGKRNREAIEV